jgi:poly(A) polymerase Pap1
MSRERNNPITWGRLFKKFPFFKAYQHFVQIQILSKNEQWHQKWKGYAESKIRRLLQGLERSNERDLNCLEFRPWPKSYHLIEKKGFELDETYFFGIRIKQVTNDQDEEGNERRE